MTRFNDPEEYRQELLHCYRALQFIARLRLDDLAAAQAHAESVGPILDPTAYMRNADKMREDAAVVHALRKAVADFPRELLDQLRKNDEAERTT